MQEEQNNKKNDLENILLHIEDGVESTQNIIGQDNKKSSPESVQQEMMNICQSFESRGYPYDPKNTIDKLEQYHEFMCQLGVERLLYSQISAYVLKLSDNQRPIFESNVYVFGSYLFDLNNNEYIDPSIKNNGIRLYDHIQLALIQHDATDSWIQQRKEFVDEELDKTKKKIERIEKNAKGIAKQSREKSERMEREYIGILGIFSSVLLACIGGFIFSTSVFSNIQSVSIYRLVLILSLVALVIVNIIYSVFYYVELLVFGTNINHLESQREEKPEKEKFENEKSEKEKKKKKLRFWTWPICIINFIICLVILLDIIIWNCGCVESRNERIYAESKNIEIVSIDSNFYK